MEWIKLVSVSLMGVDTPTLSVSKTKTPDSKSILFSLFAYISADGIDLCGPLSHHIGTHGTVWAWAEWTELDRKYSMFGEWPPQLSHMDLHQATGCLQPVSPWFPHWRPIPSISDPKHTSRTRGRAESVNRPPVLHSSRAVSGLIAALTSSFDHKMLSTYAMSPKLSSILPMSSIEYPFPSSCTCPRSTEPFPSIPIHYHLICAVIQCESARSSYIQFHHESRVQVLLETHYASNFPASLSSPPECSSRWKQEGARTWRTSTFPIPFWKVIETPSSFKISLAIKPTFSVL